MKRKSIRENYLFNMMYQVLVILLPIITTPYISRVLSADGVGAYNYSYSIAYVFVLCANLGTGAYAQREIAFCRDDIVGRSRIFFEILIIRVVAFAVVSPVYIGIAFVLDDYTKLLLIQYTMLIGTALDVSWLFQGLEDFKSTALRNIAVKIISVALMFAFVKTQSDLPLYTAIMSLSTVLSSVVLWFYLKGRVQFLNLRELHPFRHMKQVLLLFLPLAAIYVYTSIDKVVLGSLSTDAQVGYYSQAEKIVKLAMTLVTSLGTVMLPRVASLLNEEKIDEVRGVVNKSIHFVLYLGLPMMFGIMGIAPIFVPWFLGSEYVASIKLMQYLSVLVVIIGLSNVTGQAVMIPLNKQGIYTAAIVTGAVLNVICNFILIPYLDALGAVIGTIIAESTVCIIQQVTVLKSLLLHPKGILFGSWKNIVASLVMYIAIIMIRGYVDSNVVGVALVVIVGVLVYGVILLILKDEFTYNQINIYVDKFKRRMKKSR